MRLTATAQFTPRGDAGRFVSATVTPAAATGVQLATDAIVARAKQLVPVDTGELRESISGEVSIDKTVTGTITATAPHAGFVEYGTGIRGAQSADAGPYPYNPTWPGMRPQPYMRPALAEARRVIAETISGEIAVGLRK